MKFLVLTMITLLMSAETFAQSRRVRRVVTNGPVVTRPYRPVVIHTDPYVRRYTTTPRVIGPRYNPNRYTTRYVRDTRRYYTGTYEIMGYSCNYNDLYSNGRFIHSFVFTSDCSQAVSDIRFYGDFCDGSSLYDQSGAYEADFTFSSECRDALGWYY